MAADLNPTRLTLDRQSIAKLSRGYLRLKRRTGGGNSGTHRSFHSGSSIEFSEHKEYVPGDDLRHMDWRASARLGRHYLRAYEADSRLKAYLALDCSASMSYGATRPKIQLAADLVAALAYILTSQGDQVGLFTFADRELSFIPPRSHAGHTRVILHALETLELGGSTNIGASLRTLARKVVSKSLVVVLTDMLDSDRLALQALAGLRARGHHVVVFQLLHHEELSFPFSDALRLQGMEDSSSIFVDPQQVRSRYLANMGLFCQRIERACLAAQIHYRRISTNEAVEAVLLELMRLRL